MTIFPFTAVIGQDQLKLALQLNIIEPKIGGLLVMGDRGTGKSTIIRSVRDLLPKITIIKHDPFNTHPHLNKQDLGKINNTVEIDMPMINIPLSTTEDKLVGSINFEKLITNGTKIFEPGLLAKANRGILYIDEINLLDDHLVDMLLDVAASGYNIVERENISIKHQSNFILIGSGNIEEGQLRPQLLDRFGMYVHIHTVKQSNVRSTILSNRINFDLNQQKFLDNYIKLQKRARQKLINARRMMCNITLNKNLLLKIATLCSELNIDGLRGDMTLIRASKAMAAFENRTTVLVKDIKQVSTLCLSHRVKNILKNGNLDVIFNQIFSTELN